MIYTTYFANLKKLPDSIVPISICGKAPDWYKGLQYKKLAPKYGFFMEWKKNHDNNYYIKHFNEEVLNTLNSREVILDLLSMTGNIKGLNYLPHIALVCYEKPTDFCHRHLVAEWLRNDGYDVKEWR
jgi:hypothetical protein